MPHLLGPTFDFQVPGVWVIVMRGSNARSCIEHAFVRSWCFGILQMLGAAPKTQLLRKMLRLLLQMLSSSTTSTKPKSQRAVES